MCLPNDIEKMVLSSYIIISNSVKLNVGSKLLFRHC